MTVSQLRDTADKKGYSISGSKKNELISSFLSEQG